MQIPSTIKDNIDIFVFSETKLDESLPMDQFEIHRFSTPFRTDRNNEGLGGCCASKKQGV